ncbi:Solute carrier family 25 member 44 [Pseudolycoriella hygida]|uniref:Solute carrier family 25 member 44 n=1 Tax=Pseudolycoriella hygida TaxID=35572 RepID=A0A9Q0N0X7_9DIPT|nr:Solute carrier family 25 member 44 [Pseudolycoriella hygida]
MNNPDLFRHTNLASRMVRINFLDEFKSKVYWRPDGKDSLLDIGCAGGEITSENIQKILPKTFTRLVGVDINENMVKYANKLFGNTKIRFSLLDIGGDVSNFLKENEPFDHITTLNTLHLVPDQKKAIENIYKLLSPQGNCLLYTIVDSPNFCAYKKMIKKWSEYMENADDYVSFFYKRINPEYMLKKLLKDAGFKECIVEQRQHHFTYDTMDAFEATCKSIIPFYSLIPVEKQAEFMKDFLESAMEFVKVDGNKSSKDSKMPEAKSSVIEWHMLDQSKYVPLNMASLFTIRTMIYPLTVVKTKIQIQKGTAVYNGMFDAFRKIYAAEGTAGIYKGFWVSSFQIVSRLVYFSTYEQTRHLLYTFNIRQNHVRALVAGTAASVVGQACILPFDVVSQHLMVLGQQKQSSPNAGGVVREVNPLNIDYKGKSRFIVTKEIALAIFRREGILGFYRGYFTSLAMFAPNSALWWNFYQVFQDLLDVILPENTSSLLSQCIAGTLGGFAGAVIMNPVDIIRSRIQINRKRSFLETSRLLWAEEGFGIFKKGLSARCTQSVIFSLSIIFGYETIKRLSVKDEYKDKVTW